MKFKLNDRVVWKDDYPLDKDIGFDLLKGTISGIFDVGVNIQWDNGRRIHYNFSLFKEMSYYGNNDRGIGHIEIDLEYQRDKILNELGI